MAYVKQVWTDRQVERPLTFKTTENSDGTITLEPSPGTITEAGTLITAERMNHIEDGIQSADNSINTLNGQIEDLNLTKTQEYDLTNTEAGNNIIYKFKFKRISNMVTLHVRMTITTTGTLQHVKILDLSQKNVFPDFAKTTETSTETMSLDAYTYISMINSGGGSEDSWGAARIYKDTDGDYKLGYFVKDDNTSESYIIDLFFNYIVT